MSKMLIFEKYIGKPKDIGANYPHWISSAANEEGDLKGINKKGTVSVICPAV